jgi:hypothetical protein
MKARFTIVLLVLTLTLLVVALTSRDLVSNSGLSHCRLTVLSPKLKSKVIGSGVNFREVVQVEVSGTELDQELLSSLGAKNVRHVNPGNAFVISASLNTILNLSSLPKVLYIQETDLADLD